MTSYPKFIFHATEPAKVVDDATAHEAAGPEWGESPAEADAYAAAVKAKAEAEAALAAENSEKDTLIAEGEKRGIKLDGRWSIERMKAALEA